MYYRDLLDIWLEEKKLEIRNSSYRNYLHVIRVTIKPYIKEIDIKEIDRKYIQDFIIYLSGKNKKETVKNVTKVLSQSFKYAVYNNYIAKNPYIDIKIPQGGELKEIKVFKPDEINKLLSNDNIAQVKKDMITLGFRTGMRIGEVLALKWEDINLDCGFLTVRRTLSGYINGKPELSECKTKYSNRRIELDKATIDMLQRRLKENVKNHEYVFTKKDGRIYSRQGMRLRNMCKQVGIDPRSFHALRHTHASILLANGIHPKIVQERLGHAKISTTLDIYSHLIPSMQMVAVNVFNNIK